MCNNSVSLIVIHFISIFNLLHCYSRELQYKVKGISMTSFSEEDIAEIAKGGNNVCNAQYLARGGKEFPIHGGSADMTKLRDYIKAKYVDKRWFSPDGLAEVPALVDSKRRASLVGATPSAVRIPSMSALLCFSFCDFFLDRILLPDGPRLRLFLLTRHP